MVAVVVVVYLLKTISGLITLILQYDTDKPARRI